MSDSAFAIPEFLDNGLLPEGLHLATEAEALFRFGVANKRRRRLALRVRRWVELARGIGAHRFLMDGSFVTEKIEPNDVDAVVLVPENFAEMIESGHEAAIELEEMFRTRRPEELFAAEDQQDWDEWLEFFSRTRRADGCRKGLVEIII